MHRLLKARTRVERYDGVSGSPKDSHERITLTSEGLPAMMLAKGPVLPEVSSHNPYGTGTASHGLVTHNSRDNAQETPLWNLCNCDARSSTRKRGPWRAHVTQTSLALAELGLLLCPPCSL